LSGTWGGQHIRITVERGSASIEYDCATGTITGPLTINRNGSFSWKGFHTAQHGGPVRREEESNRQQATYSGSISGDTMTLRVKVSGKDEDTETYTLERGSSGEVFKCL